MRTPEATRATHRKTVWDLAALAAPRAGATTLAALCATVALCTVAAPFFAIPLAAQDRQEVRDYRKIGDTTRETPDGEVVRHSPDGLREVLAAREGEEVLFGDTLWVRYPWVMRLRLNVAPGSQGVVHLAQDVRGKDREPVAELPVDVDGATLVIHENDFGGSLVEILAGALFLENWPSSGRFCLAAAGACGINRGTSYALSVDRNGQAQLAVTADAVEIRWWGPNGALVPGSRGALDRDSLGAAAVAMDLSASATELGNAQVTVDTAQPGEIWHWTKTDPPTKKNAAGPALLADAVRFNGESIWHDSILKKWWFWTPPVAVGLCFLLDVWVCGGSDDVSGTVIINP